MFGQLQFVVRCSGIPLKELAAVAREVERDFRKFRPWHQNVRCRLEDAALVIRGRNDFDPDGDVIQDDIRSCLKEVASSFGAIEVISVEPLPDPPTGAALARPTAHNSYDAIETVAPEKSGANC